MSPARLHDWRADLDRENREATAPWWAIVYRHLWPSHENTAIAPRGSEAQRSGVDRVVCLPDGRMVTVQEKVRGVDKPDLLIEYQHEALDGRTWPGWIEHTEADVLLCIWKPTGTVRMWNMLDLRRAWVVNGGRWARTCRVYRAPNTGGYCSLNVAVPLDVLPPGRMVRVDPRVFGAQGRGGV